MSCPIPVPVPVPECSLFMACVDEPLSEAQIKFQEHKRETFQEQMEKIKEMAKKANEVRINGKEANIRSEKGKTS